jgi:hypothetical protein
MSLHQARDRAMEAQALNHRQRFLIANNTPAVDSLLEEFMVLIDRYSIPAIESVGIVRRFRELLTLEIAEYTEEREITRTVDEHIRAQHAAARPRLVVDSGLSIKRLAAILRPALRVLVSPAGHTAAELIAARRTVVDVVRSTPAERLTCASMRHELRDACHDALTSYIEDAA